MSRVSIKRRFALTAGALAVAGLVVGGGAAAANAATPPAPAPALVAVDGAPEMATVQPGELTPVPGHPPLIVDGDDISLTEVPGAAPDLSEVEVVDATPVVTAPQVVGDGTTTAENATILPS